MLRSLVRAQAELLPRRRLLARLQRLRPRRRSERAATVDQLAVRALVRHPRHPGLLVDARSREVAHARGEDLLQRAELRVGHTERAVVVAARERLQLALVRVLRDLVPGDRAR